MPAARRLARRSRVGSVLFMLGFIALLGVTFGLGMFVGRTWPTWPSVLARAGESAGRRDGRSERRPVQSAPAFTFYQELTAPLTAPPVNAPKPAKPAPPAAPVPTRPALAPAVPARDAGASAVAPAIEAPSGASVTASASAVASNPPSAPPTATGGPAAKTPALADSASAARFTIQVGAFKDRPPAEALRATLALYGHEVYIAESDVDGARFRVRVGAYATRDEARAVAARIAAERHVATYVTTR
jgi:DedD protein